MTPQQRFKFQRDAFRIFIADKDERELEHLMDDIKLRMAYLKSINPVNIIKGLHDLEDASMLDGD
jgi:hypothetical protein